MLGIPYKVHTTVRQWNNISTTGTDRAEDCIIDLDDVWYDADGTLITNPDRIAELEQTLAQKTE